MASLIIGKSHKGLFSNKLDNLRNNLLQAGRKESERNSPSSYAEAVEIVINAIFEGIPDLVCDAFKVLDNPPSTWDRYLATHEGEKIYEMEFSELREAVKRDIKSDKNELHVHKEMKHVLAAAIYMALIDDK